MPKTGILLFHGLAGTAGEVKYVANQLTRRGYHVFTPTVGGLACGSDCFNLARWRDWLSSACRALDQATRQCDVLYVGGLSAGATLALRLAIERPSHIQGLLLLAPTLSVNGWAIPNTMKLFNLVQARWLARRFNFEERQPFGLKDERVRSMVVDGLKREFAHTDVNVFRVNGVALLELRRLASAVRRDLKSISHPVLLVHPRDDDQADLNNSFDILLNVSGPVESVVLDDSYHFITLDRQRQLVVDAIDRFVHQNANWVSPAITERESGLASQRHPQYSVGRDFSA